MGNKFTLVFWPWSQTFIGQDDCLFYSGETDGSFDPAMSQAIFVPNGKLTKMNAEELLRITDGLGPEYTGLDADGTDANGSIGCHYDEEEEDLVFVQNG